MDIYWQLYLRPGLHDSFPSECTHLKQRNLIVLELLKQRLTTSNMKTHDNTEIQVVQIFHNTDYVSSVYLYILHTL